MGASSPEYRWLWPSALAAEPAGPLAARRSTRDWVVDTLCFLLAGAFTVWIVAELLDPASETTRTWGPAPIWLTVLDAVASTVAAVALWWRRRFLTALALFSLPLAAFSMAGSLTVLIVVFTVGVHRRFAVLAGYTVLMIGANVIFAATRPQEGPGYWEAFGWGTAVTVIAALWGMIVRGRRQLIVTWRDRAERAESEQRLRVAQARVLERTRIAREMHDVLAHQISLVSLHAGALEFRPGAPPEEIAGAAAVVRSSAHQALQDLRAVIGVLRAGQPEDEHTPERPQPTLSAIPVLADESRSAGNRVLIEIAPDPESVPAAIGRAAYRIVQEGLTNARKHAPGAVVRIAVDGAPGDGLRIEVRNPMPVAVPARPIPGTGMGLIGLGERALLAGGTLDHGRAGDDFVLTAWLPWPL